MMPIYRSKNISDTPDVMYRIKYHFILFLPLPGLLKMCYLVSLYTS